MKRHSLSRIVLVTVCVFMTSSAFAEDCPVTPSGNGIYENDELLVVLGDPKFIFEPRGGGFIDHDGALGIKVGWRRKTRGQLEVTGRRIDATAPPLRAYIPPGYGDIGFQSSYVVFPTPGCWEVVARVGQRNLTFVVAVELIPPGPSSHLNGVPRGWRQTGG